MAPFPESESMTIKRLEVAIRKKDMHLLKDGAYKLHEKFHTGHKFEFLSELEQILEYVKTSDIPLEITEILCPTIEEILDLPKENTAAAAPQEQIQPAIKEEDIKLQGQAYEEYMAQQEASEEIKEFEENFIEDNIAPKEPEEKIVEQVQVIQTTPKETPVAEDVALFYDDNASDIDYLKIKEYRNKLNFLFSSHNDGDYNLLKDIAILNNLVNIKVFDIDKVLSMLKTSKGKVSFITTSQSSDLTKILKEKEINFEIPFVKGTDTSDFTFIPMLGLSDIFVCSNCNLRSLKSDFSTKTISVQCPNCDSAAFPDLYAVNSYNPDCNPIFWHRAFSSLVKSKIWIFINPPLDENKEVIFDFIKTASECSNPDRIYLFSKENDKREFYKNMFLKALPNCDVRYNFYNIEQLCEEYIRANYRQN